MQVAVVVEIAGCDACQEEPAAHRTSGCDRSVLRPDGLSRRNSAITGGACRFKPTNIGAII
jgi:hypothetical protein